VGLNFNLNLAKNSGKQKSERTQAFNATFHLKTIDSFSHRDLLLKFEPILNWIIEIKINWM